MAGDHGRRTGDAGGGAAGALRGVSLRLSGAADDRVLLPWCVDPLPAASARAAGMRQASRVRRWSAELFAKVLSYPAVIGPVPPCLKGHQQPDGRQHETNPCEQDAVPFHRRAPPRFLVEPTLVRYQT